MMFHIGQRYPEPRGLSSSSVRGESCSTAEIKPGGSTRYVRRHAFTALFKDQAVHMMCLSSDCGAAAVQPGRSQGAALKQNAAASRAQA
jgi:hypothetical protein